MSVIPRADKTHHPNENAACQLRYGGDETFPLWQRAALRPGGRPGKLRCVARGKRRWGCSHTHTHTQWQSY